MWLGVCSLKGSPGATTLAVVTAGLWPADRQVVIFEADLDGGCLASRFGLHPDEPGVLSLAADARHGVDKELVWRNLQTLPGGVPVLVEPSLPAQASPALAALATHIPNLTSELGDTDVVLDLGRLQHLGCPDPFVDAADLVIVAVRPTYEELDRLVSFLPTLTGATEVAVVLTGAGPYGFDDVSATIEKRSEGLVPLLGQVSFDPRGASALNLGRGGTRSLRRSLLVRSAKPIVEAIFT